MQPPASRLVGIEVNPGPGRLPGTPLVVDQFHPTGVGVVGTPDVFFLTHAHTDHTKGLSKDWSGRLYCTELTKLMLQAKFGQRLAGRCVTLKVDTLYQVKDGSLAIDVVPMPIHSTSAASSSSIRTPLPPFPLKRAYADAFAPLLDASSSSSSSSASAHPGTFTVTLFDSNHCPGSVMFHFQSPLWGSILHTGDCRFEASKFASPLWRAISGRIDRLYFDSTFCDAAATFPSREAVIEKINDAINGVRERQQNMDDEYFDRRPDDKDATPSSCDYRIYISCCDLGSELLLAHILHRQYTTLYVHPSMSGRAEQIVAVAKSMMVVPSGVEMPYHWRHCSKNVASNAGYERRSHIHLVAGTKFNKFARENEQRRMREKRDFLKHHADTHGAAVTAGRFVDPTSPPLSLYVRPTTQYFMHATSLTSVAAPPVMKVDDDDTVTHFLYSMHSDVNEIVDLINVVRPRAVMPLEVPSCYRRNTEAKRREEEEEEEEGGGFFGRVKNASTMQASDRDVVGYVKRVINFVSKGAGWAATVPVLSCTDVPMSSQSVTAARMEQLTPDSLEPSVPAYAPIPHEMEMYQPEQEFNVVMDDVELEHSVATPPSSSQSSSQSFSQPLPSSPPRSVIADAADVPTPAASLYGSQFLVDLLGYDPDELMTPAEAPPLKSEEPISAPEAKATKFVFTPKFVHSPPPVFDAQELDHMHQAGFPGLVFPLLCMEYLHLTSLRSALVVHHHVTWFLDSFPLLSYPEVRVCLLLPGSAEGDLGPTPKAGMAEYAKAHFDAHPIDDVRFIVMVGSITELLSRREPWANTVVQQVRDDFSGLVDLGCFEADLRSVYTSCARSHAYFTTPPRNYNGQSDPTMLHILVPARTHTHVLDVDPDSTTNDVADEEALAWAYGGMFQAFTDRVVKFHGYMEKAESDFTRNRVKIEARRLPYPVYEMLTPPSPPLIAAMPLALPPPPLAVLLPPPPLAVLLPPPPMSFDLIPPLPPPSPHLTASVPSPSPRAAVAPRPSLPLPTPAARRPRSPPSTDPLFKSVCASIHCVFHPYNLCRVRIGIFESQLTKRGAVVSKWDPEAIPLTLTHIFVDPSLRGAAMDKCCQLIKRKRFKGVAIVDCAWVMTGLQTGRAVNISWYIMDRTARAVTHTAGAANEVVYEDEVIEHSSINDQQIIQPITSASSSSSSLPSYDVKSEPSALVLPPSSTSTSSSNAHLIVPFESLQRMYACIDDDPRSRSYTKIVTCLQRHPRPLRCDADVDAFGRTTVGIGPSTVAKLKEILATGSLQEAIAMSARPEIRAIEALTAIHGVGAKTARDWFALHVTTLDELRSAVASGRISLSSTQTTGLAFVADAKKRIPRAEVEAIIEHVREVARTVMPAVTVTCCGSYRRGAESCGDVDLLFTSERFECVKMKEQFLQSVLDRLHSSSSSSSPFVTGDLTHTLTRDATTSWMGYCSLPRDHPHHSRAHRRLDMKVYAEAQRPFALLYFTGSAEFNRRMRGCAKVKCGMTLSDKGMSKAIRGGDGKIVHTGASIKCKSEHDIFEQIGMTFVPPNQRN